MTAVATDAVVGRSRDDAVASLMRRMREYTVAHPHRYAAVPADPVHDPALAEPAEKFLRVFLAVLRGYDLSGPAAVHATRCLRVIVYGFAAIESSGGFGLAEDPAETYEHLIDMYLTSLR
jgi:hypothetical protein